MGVPFSSYFEAGDEGYSSDWRHDDVQDSDILHNLYEGYHPTEEDVFEIREILLGFIPVELINITLEEAQCWPRLLGYNGEPHAQQSGPHGECTSWQSFIMPPIPPPLKGEDGREVHMKIRKVVFWIRSCDQGWGGDQNLTGLYEGSWTWFDARIYRCLPGDAPVELRTKLQCKNIPAPDELALHTARIDLVTNHADGSNVWHLQRNVRASSENAIHKIVWEHDGDGSGDSISDDSTEYDRETGAGSGIGFVRLLRAGDRIVVISHARFPGWKNNIYEVAAEIFYSV